MNSSIGIHSHSSENQPLKILTQAEASVGQRAANCQQTKDNIDRLTTVDKLYGNLSVSTDTGEPRGRLRGNP